MTGITAIRVKTLQRLMHPNVNPRYAITTISVQLI